MTRILPLLAALAIAAPATAATYSAKPVAAPEAGRFAAKDILWTCAADRCSGRTDESRPVVLCQSLARKTGRIESFTGNGIALSAEELAKCNTAAKPLSGPALAKAQ